MSAVSAEKEAALTLAEARNLFRYEPETGGLIMLTGKRRGYPVKTRLGRYLMVRAKGIKFVAHRVIWLLVHGEWPPSLLDHKDGDGTNNRLSNLRLATPQQNMSNMRICKRNTTGAKGVSPKGKKFIAVIYFNYKKKYLGIFETKELAAKAYADAATELFGEFAMIA
jgi:hypothetical protein